MEKSKAEEIKRCKEEMLYHVLDILELISVGVGPAISCCWKQLSLKIHIQKYLHYADFLTKCG